MAPLCPRRDATATHAAGRRCSTMAAMARILVGSVPAAGHVNPLVPIVRALCARGQYVRWIAGRNFRAKVEATGARFVAMTHARDYDDAHIDDEFPRRAQLHGLAKLKFDMKHVFIDNGPGQ